MALRLFVKHVSFLAVYSSLIVIVYLFAHSFD